MIRSAKRHGSSVSLSEPGVPPFVNKCWTPGSVGILLGMVGGFFLARGLSSELFGVEPLDLRALAATVLGLVVLGIAAAAGPIRRALWIQPAGALRIR